MTDPIDLDALRSDLRYGRGPTREMVWGLIAELEATRASYNAEESRAERAEAELEDARRDTFSRSGHGNVDHWCERAERAEAERDEAISLRARDAYAESALRARAERAEAELAVTRRQRDSAEDELAGFAAWRPFPNECAECVARKMRCHCG